MTTTNTPTVSDLRKLSPAEIIAALVAEACNADHADRLAKIADPVAALSGFPAETPVWQAATLL
jgi:hypothetical protein